ncbi:MAG: hypothetical protein GXP62_18695 [Oligoflexia bacterium]|nr:hypothetical protein [Oligoflexia bacterium]
MKSLKSQLTGAFGPSPSTDAVSTESPDDPLSQGILAEGAHLDSPWIARLRVLAASLSDGPDLGDGRKLAHAQQITAQVMRSLKKVRRKDQAKMLGKLRNDWLAQRDKAAWAAVKLHFKELGLSDKAYRGIKQQGADPVLALERLSKADPAELTGLGATRLKALLGK